MLEVPQFETIGSGGLKEDFDSAIEQVANDIRDMNKGTEPREISVKIRFSPDSSRQVLQATYQVEVKTGKRIPGTDIFHIGRNQDGVAGKVSMYRNRQDQLTFVEDLTKETIDVDRSI